MITLGDVVRLSYASPELLFDLPVEDQQMIQWAVNKIDMTVVNIDVCNNIELEFEDQNNTLRWITVKTTDLHTV